MLRIFNEFDDAPIEGSSSPAPNAAEDAALHTLRMNAIRGALANRGFHTAAEQLPELLRYSRQPHLSKAFRESIMRLISEAIAATSAGNAGQLRPEEVADYNRALRIVETLLERDGIVSPAERIERISYYLRVGRRFPGIRKALNALLSDAALDLLASDAADEELQPE